MLDMRICSKCKKCPPRNRTSSYCKGCHNEYQKAYYRKNPRSISESGKRRKKEIRELIVSVKNCPCVDCGKEYPYYVMDFDHREGTKKKFVLAKAASNYKSLSTVQEEIDKCDVVCANCHRERTFKRSGV